MDFENLKVGLKNSLAQIVSENDTALAVGSGSLKVLATPKLIALVEKAAAFTGGIYNGRNFGKF